MKLLLIPLIALGLIGCAKKSPNLIKEKIVVLQVPESYYNCPTVKSFPNPDKLTDIQVARLIVTLYQNNQTCKNSLEGIKKFIQEAEQITSK